MKQNKKIREELEKIYGKGCMFEKAKIAEKIEQKKTIKTYKKFIEGKRFSGKIIKKYKDTMTLHHLQHRSEKGKTTVENGAVVNSLAHMYLHSLPRNQEEFINNELREYKRQIDENRNAGECEVVLADDLEVPYEVQAIEFSVNEKGKYNRAKKLQEDRKMIKEWEEER